MNQKFWEEHLKGLEEKRKAVQELLDSYDKSIEVTESRVREASQWKLHGANWRDPSEVSWEELMAYVPRQGNAGKKKVTMTIRLDRVEWTTGRRSTDRLAIALRIESKKEETDE